MSEVFDSEIQAGLTGTGVRIETVSELKELLLNLRSRQIFVSAMEVFEVTDEGEIANLQLSIVGLDGDENWEVHESPQIAMDLLEKKLDLAPKIKGDKSLIFQVWLHLMNMH